MWHNVRLMNKLTAYLMLLACIFLLAAAVRSVMHLPYFALHTVVVEAAENNVLQHIKAAEVRANISGKLRGNFFTADLESVRQTFLSLPWVRSASVRRSWPDSLIVTLEEYIPWAVWGAPTDSRLVNRDGEIFRVNHSDLMALLKRAELIRLVGSEANAKDMVDRYKKLEMTFSPLGWKLVELSLNKRASWSARFSHGLRVEFGRDDNESGKPTFEQRLQQFVQAWPKIMNSGYTDIVYADLRYNNGFAIRQSGERGGKTVGQPAQSVPLFRRLPSIRL